MDYSSKVQGGSKPFTPPGEKMPKKLSGTPETCTPFTPPPSKMPDRMR